MQKNATAQLRGVRLALGVAAERDNSIQRETINIKVPAGDFPAFGPDQLIYFALEDGEPHGAGDEPSGTTAI